MQKKIFMFVKKRDRKLPSTRRPFRKPLPELFKQA